MVRRGTFLTLALLALSQCKRREHEELAPVPVLRASAAPSVAPSASVAALPPLLAPHPGDAPIVTVKAFRNAIVRGEGARALSYYRREDQEIARLPVKLFLKDPGISKLPLSVKAARMLAGSRKRAEIDVTVGTEALTYFLVLQDGIWKLDNAAERRAANASLAAHLRDAGFSDAKIQEGLDLVKKLGRRDGGP